MKQLTILFILIITHTHARSLEEEVQKITDSLKAGGVEKLFIHQYSLFTGRYEIPYDDDELQCEKIPTVVHIFWYENEQWRCLRLDHCGLFETVSIGMPDFDKLVIDEQVKFKTLSPHFTKYSLTRLYKDNRESANISGSQLRNEKSRTIRTFKKINKIIKGLEDRHQFKRVQ